MNIFSTLKIGGVALAAAATVFMSSCRSVLYNAAERGDLRTVELQLTERHADVNAKPSKAHLWWQIPTYLVTVPVDITLNYGSVFILPLYVENPFVTTKWVADFGKKTALEAALENGHLDVVECLIAHGAKCSPELKARFNEEKETKKLLQEAKQKLRKRDTGKAEAAKWEKMYKDEVRINRATTPQ